MLRQLGEEIVPPADQAALVLVINQIELERLPVLADLLEVALERRLALRLRDDLAVDGVVLDQIGFPDLAQSEIRQHPARVELGLERLPVPLLHRLGLEIDQDNVPLQVTLDRLLHVLKGAVLPHAVGQLLEAVGDVIEHGADLLGLHIGPRRLAQRVHLAPHARQLRPHALCARVSAASSTVTRR